MKEAQSQSFVQPSMQLQELHPPTRHLIELQWRDGGKVPYKMHRGAAVVDGNVAYFMDYDGYTIHLHRGGVSFLSVPIGMAV